MQVFVYYLPQNTSDLGGWPATQLTDPPPCPSQEAWRWQILPGSCLTCNQYMPPTLWLWGTDLCSAQWCLWEKPHWAISFNWKAQSLYTTTVRISSAFANKLRARRAPWDRRAVLSWVTWSSRQEGRQSTDSVQRNSCGPFYSQVPEWPLQRKQQERVFLGLFWSYVAQSWLSWLPVINTPGLLKQKQNNQCVSYPLIFFSVLFCFVCVMPRIEFRALHMLSPPSPTPVGCFYFSHHVSPSWCYCIKQLQC